MDLFKVNEQYRKFYSVHNKSKDTKPMSHIDDCTTYLIHAENKDIDLYDRFSKGMSANEFRSYFYSITQSLPTDNMKVIIERDGRFTAGYFYHCGEKMAVSVDIKAEYGSSYLAIACLYNVLKDLENKDTYIAIQNVEYKNKRSGKIIPDEIVYVSRVRGVKKISTVFDGPVNWMHSWSVVGHWRVTSGIGVNRVGLRSEVGRTWIKPCIKGKGDFVSKTRVVGG